MKNVYGILNLHGWPNLGPLTEEHPLGSISFLGRYGVMDFALSNLTNSGIDRIAILVEKNSHSVRSHIQGGHVWIANTKTGDLGEYINEKALNTPSYNTDLANLKANLLPLESQIIEDYVVIVPPYFVMTLDYSKVVEEHISSGADITLIYSNRKNAKTDFLGCYYLIFNSEGKISSIDKNKGDASKRDIFLETYVINKRKLAEIIEISNSKSKTYSLIDIISDLIDEGSINVNSYSFENIVIPITSLQNYVKYSFALLDEDLSNQLFKKDWPIYTTTHNTAPTIYGKNAEVSNSFIANGSQINGKVENSILSRNVIVEEGAIVKNSIIFTKTSISSEAKVQYVLLGKHVNISSKKKISGSKNDVFFVDYGAKI